MLSLMTVAVPPKHTGEYTVNVTEVITRQCTMLIRDDGYICTINGDWLRVSFVSHNLYEYHGDHVDLRDVERDLDVARGIMQLEKPLGDLSQYEPR